MCVGGCSRKVLQKNENATNYIGDEQLHAYKWKLYTFYGYGAAQNVVRA